MTGERVMVRASMSFATLPVTLTTALVAALSVRLDRSRLFLLALLMPAAVSAQSYCFDDAGASYGVSPVLLRVIAQKESGMRPAAVHRNPDGSRDLGLMQINSRWLPVLARQGVREADLFDPCTNAHVAAWILASNFSQLGLGLEAIGAYNARSAHLRAAYARDVIRRLRRAAGLI